MLTCGIDEAGRGPIIGPMVMAGVLVDEQGAARLKNIDVKDSKMLTQKRRVELFKQIISIAKKHKIIVVQPKEIDEALNSENMNLNWLEAKTTAQIINSIKPEKAIIDCPSNNIVKYKEYLMNLFDNKEIETIVEHKADVNYIESAAASILAKVTREAEIEKLKKSIGDFGSGYLTDPKTTAFFDKNFEKHQNVFRKTWAPYKKRLAAKNQKGINEY
jgi:ribonuclease HII